ncbi:hypothetical protein NsoK4_05685 [Nitrosopumilus sp. K4]|uniref:hypothetical protein n=1 Tax=Nitrosopumilus sp. K4 TaxID=2795383 RepID=UPI001BAD10F4|nr:hypothetical protein [Nitrosopumilus sp. K4]QUC63954.1 hypothetical protein NsoK4_05685 [Nitrosopumilus sp. K4]
MNLEKLCEEVIKSDPKIRFTGILNPRGDLDIQKNKNDDALLTGDEVKMSVHYTYERWNQLQNLEYKLGKEVASITEYENVIMISIVLEKNLFLLSTEPDADYSKIISNVKSIIAKNQ